MSNLKNNSSPLAKRVYGKKNAEARILERRERLLQAALALFASQGYANTTIESLCSEAKVTTRHFYQIFPSREELLLALYNQMMDELNMALLNAIQTEDISFQEKIRRIVKTLVTHYLTDTRYAQVGVLEVVGASPLIEHRRREVIYGIAKQIQLFLQNAPHQKQVAYRNYHWLAIAIVGGINEVMAEWLMNRELDLEQLSQEILFIVETLLRGVPVYYSD